MNKAIARRRARRHGLKTKFWQPQLGEGRRPWVLLAVGALLFALVAFVSGVRMGKALSDFHRVKGPSSPTQAEEPRESPSTSKIKESEPSPSMEAQSSMTVPENPKWEGYQTPQGKPKFTLQVAAFNNPEEARELVNQLRNKGYPAYQIPENSVAKEMWHRVRVGHFQSLQEARQFALTFEKKEKIKTIIANLQSP